MTRITIRAHTGWSFRTDGNTCIQIQRSINRLFFEISNLIWYLSHLILNCSKWWSLFFIKVFVLEVLPIFFLSLLFQLLLRLKHIIARKSTENLVVLIGVKFSKLILIKEFVDIHFRIRHIMCNSVSRWIILDEQTYIQIT